MNESYADKGSHNRRRRSTRAGYRDVIERAARKMKLTGIVLNIKPYDVRFDAHDAKAGQDERKNRLE